MNIRLVLKQGVALCFRRITVDAVPTVHCFIEDSFTLQVEVYHTRFDISPKSTRPWDTRQYTLYTFCPSPIVLMDRSQMTQIRTWGGRRLMDQPSVRKDTMWAKNMPFLLLNEMWRQPKCPWCELSDDHAASERLRRMQDKMEREQAALGAAVKWKYEGKNACFNLHFSIVKFQIHSESLSSYSLFLAEINQ